MKNEQIMATANNTSVPNELLLFQIAPLYSNETRKGCGLLGKEIDANFQYLNGNDIVDFHVVKTEEEGDVVKNKLIITLRNGYEFPVDIDEELRSDTFSYDPEHGVFTVTRYDGTEIKLNGFLVEGKDIHVANDGTIDGDGTWKNPLTLSPTLKTGVYAPVRQYVDLTDTAGHMTLEDFVAENADKYPKLKGLRFITKEKINSFGYLYSLKGAKKAVELAGNGWRIPTLDDWNSMMNYVETFSGCTCDNPHEGLSIRELGCKAGKVLKSVRMWIDDGVHFGTDEFGFTVLPVGSMLCNQSIDENVPDFLKNAYFWTGTDFEGNGAWIKSFSYTTNTVRQEPDAGVRMYSLRLVKDAEWDGVDNEVIAGQVVPCASFPYIDEEGDVRSRLWTLINVAIPIPDTNEYRYPSLWDEYSEETEFRSTQPGYFICEHDGHEWKKRQMMDGDSVIIIDTDTLDGTDDNEKEYTQYRVEWDEEIEEYVLVDVLDVFRNEVSDMLSNMEGRVVLLEEMAHTHENKEVLDTISQERVEAWDAAEANAITSAITYADEKFEELSGAVETLSGSTVSVVDSIGLDENLEPDFTAYRYIQVSQDDCSTDPVPGEYIENPTKEDPQSIYMISGRTVVFFEKIDATQYIRNSGNIVNALKDLDTAIRNEKTDREEAVSTAKAEAIAESEAYTDEKITEVNDDIHDLETALDAEERERRRADDRLYVKPKDKSISVLHCTDGTYINVNLSNIYSGDTLPNHLGLDRDGIYFDGFFGVIPGTIELTRSYSIIEYLGVTYDNIQHIGEGASTLYSVDWTAKFRLSEGKPVASPLTLEVQENLMDADGNNIVCGFTVSFASGQTEGSAKVTLVSDAGSHAGAILSSEIVDGSLKFRESDSNTITVMEFGVAHDYKLKSTFEMANERIVRYGVKKHSDSEGFTREDLENALVAEIDADNSINITFSIPSVSVPGFEEMGYEESEAARRENAYDFFIITNKDIRMTIPANAGNDINLWELKRWSVEGIAVSRMSSPDNVNIYDPINMDDPGYVYIPYEIRFSD